jgi:hypothetical protein
MVKNLHSPSAPGQRCSDAGAGQSGSDNDAGSCCYRWYERWLSAAFYFPAGIELAG